MKHLLYILSTFILSMAFGSCKKDFLDSVNEGGNLIREEYVKDINTTGEYLNGIYVAMSSELIHGYAFVYGDLAADNVKPISYGSGTSPQFLIYNWQQQPNESQSSMGSNSDNCNGISYTAYKLIRACNFVLESADKYHGQAPDQANNLKGHALAIRAFVYLNLLNVFAQPYNFTTNSSHPGVVWVNTSSWNETNNNRLTVGECYKKIVDDLVMAGELLDGSPINNLEFNMVSVNALLARIYLNMEQFTLARNHSLSVLKTVPIMRVNYPSALFTETDSEAILRVGPSDYTYFGYTTSFVSIFFRTSLEFSATQDIAELLQQDSNDLRSSWVTESPDNMIITKYPESVIAQIGIPSASYYQTLIRSSEMALIAAECYANLNMRDSAVYYLDDIRLRANPNAKTTTSSGTQLMEDIYDERRKELAFEGFRLFDLLRWKKSVSRVDVLDNSNKVLPYPSNHAVAPIPLLDVKSMRISQNLDY